MKDSPENVHAGHRKRMRAKVLENGFSGMEDHEMLEVMLYNVIARGDTNPIAHRLIKRFGGIKGVFDTPINELTAVEGVGEKTAQYINFLGQFIMEYNKRIAKPRRFILGSIQTEVYLHELFRHQKRESMYMFCLDIKSKIISVVNLGEGEFSSIGFNISTIVRKAVQYDPAYVVIAHNHPSGNSRESKADRIGTSVMLDAFKTVGVILSDHIIVTDDAVRGLISGYFADGYASD